MYHPFPNQRLFPKNVLLSYLLLLLCFLIPFNDLQAQKSKSKPKVTWGPWQENSTTPNDDLPVTIYDNRYFGTGGAGSKAMKLGDHPNLGNLSGKTSSIVVPRDRKVTLYYKKGLQGKSITFYPGKFPNIGDWEGHVKSLKVEAFDPDTPLAYFYDKLTVSSSVPQRWISLPAGEYTHDQIVCNDCISTIIIPSSLSVLVYNEYDFKGKNNESSPFENPTEKPKSFKMTDWGFENRISGVKVRLQGYRLDKVEFTNEVITESQDSIIKTTATALNETSLPITTNVSINQNYQTTITQTSATNWSNTAGVSIAVTASPKIFGLGASITTTIQESKTVGGNSSNGKSENVSHAFNESLTVQTPTNCRSRIDLSVIPITYTYDMKKTFIPVDLEGKDILNRPPVTSTAKVNIRSAVRARAKASEVCGDKKLKMLKNRITNN